MGHGWPPSGTSHYTQSAISHQLSAISYQLSALKLSVLQLSVVSCDLVLVQPRRCTGLVRDQQCARLARPPFLPCGTRRTPRAGPQTIEPGRLGGKRFEQIEQEVGELPGVREQPSVDAV